MVLAGVFSGTQALMRSLVDALIRIYGQVIQDFFRRAGVLSNRFPHLPRQMGRQLCKGFFVRFRARPTASLTSQLLSKARADNAV